MSEGGLMQVTVGMSLGSVPDRGSSPVRARPEQNQGIGRKIRFPPFAHAIFTLFIYALQCAAHRLVGLDSV